MAERSPTRTNLIALKTQIKTVSQGKDLLEQKRDALLIEFLKVIDEAIKADQELEQTIRNARYALNIARTVDGIVTLKSVSLATKGEVLLNVVPRSIMGVPIPDVEKRQASRSSLTRGYGITGVSSRVDDVAEKFEEVINAVINLAAVETKLKRLGEELERTRRRVNALNNLVLPELTTSTRVIAQALEERAREDVFRLKKVKAKLK